MFKKVIKRILVIIGYVCLGLFLLLPPRTLFFFSLGLLIIAVFKLTKNQSLKPLFPATGFFIVCQIVKYMFYTTALIKSVILIIIILLILKLKATKTIYSIGLILIWLVLGIWIYDLWWPYETQTTNAPVLFLGDSLTAGLEGDEGILFTTQLQKEFSTPIINAGVPGNMTKDALNRLEKDVLLKNPCLVVVMIGGNDILSRKPRKALEETIEKIVTQIQDKGINVLLVEIPGGAIFDKYLGVYQQTAKQHHLYTIKEGTLRRIFFLSSYYTSDGIHLNKNGHSLLTKRFSKILSDKYNLQ